MYRGFKSVYPLSVPRATGTSPGGGRLPTAAASQDAVDGG